MALGKLYGIGVGPGASDLMTLRAVNALNSVDVLAIPRPNAYSKSLAYRIVEPNLKTDSDSEKLFLTFPMSKDKEVIKPYWEHAFSEVIERLKQGLDVGFISQGDAFVYSTFIYLFNGVKDQLPEVEVEVIPAVTSVTAVSSSALRPLVDGKEKVAILPATYGIEDLRQILRMFDSVALMKVGSVMPNVVKALELEGLIDNAYYVERATTSEEKIVTDLRTLKNDKCIYFSMVIVNKSINSGVLSPFDYSKEKEA